MGMGSEADLHTADVVELLPASMKVAEMVADNPGVWMFHCHVNTVLIGYKPGQQPNVS